MREIREQRANLGNVGCVCEGCAPLGVRQVDIRLEFQQGLQRPLVANAGGTRQRSLPMSSSEAKTQLTDQSVLVDLIDRNLRVEQHTRNRL